MSIVRTLVLAAPAILGGAEAPPLAFVEAPGSPIHVGPMAGRPAVADCDGDGILDVVVACGTCCGDRQDPKSGHIVVLLGDGRGGFRRAPGSPIGVGPSVRKLALGDLDGDGRIDLVAAEHDRYEITVLLGDGRGGFRPAPGSPVLASPGNRPHTHDVVLAEVSGDGRLDVITTNSNDNALSVLLGDGKGGFSPAEGSPFATGRHPYDGIVAEDLNRDGKVDLVVPLMGGNKIGVLLGDGRRGFAHAPDSRIPVGERPGYTAVGDLDGDGNLDVLASHDDVGMVDLLLGDGTGRFRIAEGSPLTLSTPVWGIALGDLDGDGDLDALLGAAQKGEPVILLGDGKGRLTEVTGLDLDAGDAPGYVALADFDRDGRLDFVTGNYGSGDLSIFLGVRNPTQSSDIPRPGQSARSQISKPPAAPAGRK